MKKKLTSKTPRRKLVVNPGGVDEYITECPKEAQRALNELRSSIRSVAPNAIETVSYFGIPGYSYEGYPYNGMFAWFSFKAPFVRLHVRPEALIQYKKDVEVFTKTKAVISFFAEKPLPKTLVKKLVRASIKDMKEKAV